MYDAMITITVDTETCRAIFDQCYTDVKNWGDVSFMMMILYIITITAVNFKICLLSLKISRQPGKRPL